jgi:16S rRNA C967 or C1407 C5-methylase (RsmB/RsmF family)
MLVHQCKRINSPLLMITTHLGQDFPTLVADVPEGDLSAINISKLRKNGFFDRVLCDVPCSGDGTMRKQPNIWGKWNTASGFGLHPLQLQIAERGLKLLKPDGLMVYSTCSMSPYGENFADPRRLLFLSVADLYCVVFHYRG